MAGCHTVKVIHGTSGHTNTRQRQGTLTNPETTTLDVREPVASERASSEQRHGVHHTVSHTVSLEVQSRLEFGSIRLGLLEAGVLHESMEHDRAFDTLSQQRIDISRRELDVLIRQQLQRLRETSQLTRELGQHLGRANLMHLHAQSLSQTERELHPVLRRGQVQHIPSREDGFTHQLAGLGVVLAQHLKAVHDRIGIPIMYRQILDRRTLHVGNVGEFGHQALNRPESRLHRQTTTLNRPAMVDVERVRHFTSKQLHHQIFTHTSEDVDEGQVHLVLSGLLGLDDFLLLLGHRSVRTKLGISHLLRCLADIGEVFGLHQNCTLNGVGKPADLSVSRNRSDLAARLIGTATRTKQTHIIHGYG